MRTKLILAGSAVVLGLLGLGASFAPQELLGMVGVASAAPVPLLIQLLGAGYFGLALSNWLAKDSSIGGIYGRSLTLGNSVHFTVGALALAKAVIGGGMHPLISVLPVIYAGFALAFAWLVFGATGLPKQAAKHANERA